MKQMIVLCFLFIIGACSTTFKEEGVQDSAQHTRNGEINFGGNSSVQVTH